MTPDTDLRGLHPFYQPPPPAWTPQTVGWYFVLACVAALAGFILWRVFRSWRRNRYRREALAELAHTSVLGIPVLLKRTALVAWPRETVASLSGDNWLHFLATHGGESGFTEGAGRQLLDLDYRICSLGEKEETELRHLAGKWIRKHRVRP